MSHRTLLLLFVVFAGASAPAQMVWTETETEHFALYVQGEESGSVQALNRLETARSGLLLTPWADGVPHSRVNVVAFANQSEYAAFCPNRNAFAYFRHIRNLDYIVMQQLRGGPERTVVHEYVHAVFNHVAPNLPMWVAEGLAEAYSYASVDQTTVVFGGAVPEHVKTLRTLTVDNIRSMFEPEADNLSASPRNMWQTYAADWAAIYMMLGDIGYAPRFPRFIASVNNTSTEQALQMIYRESLKTFANHVAQSLTSMGSNKFLLRVSMVRAQITGKGEPPEVRLQAILADLVSPGSQKQTRIQSRLEELAVLSISDPAADEALGFLAMRNERTQDAGMHFRVALSKSSTNAEAILCLSEIEERSGAPFGGALALLQKAFEVDPTNTNSRLRLGVLEVKAREYSMAIATLTGIHDLAPNQTFDFFYALAYCSLKTKQRSESNEFGLRALQVAGNDAQRIRAERLLRWTGP